MRPARCNDRRRAQRGATLFESLVGLLLGGILCLGMAHNTAQVIKELRYTTLQTAAVVQLRDRLTHAADLGVLCAGSGDLAFTLPTGSTASVATTITCSWASVTVSEAGTGLSTALPGTMLGSLSLSTVTAGGSAVELFGGDGLLRITQ